MKKYLEENKKILVLEIVLIVILFGCSIFSFLYGFNKINKDVNSIEYIETIEMNMDSEQDQCDEDSLVCDVLYRNNDETMTITFPYDEYLDIKDKTIKAYKYETDDNVILYFEHLNPSQDEISNQYRQYSANKFQSLFNFAITCTILLISLLIITLLSKFFTTYEKIWFISIMLLASIFAVLFPEESANGINGIVIMLLYLSDTFLNILCELLISKQSRYNFLVSVLVEIVEILICIVLMYRFATMAVTLFFWLPIDIISFVNWSKHKDDKQEELTIVRKLSGYQEGLVVGGIIIWTFVIGYLISGLDIKTDFLNKNINTIIIYLDACASVVGIANGLFILFRLQEQWIAWYISAILETIMNILCGQYVLLILKLGYFTNTTYGYLKWNRYIKNHQGKMADDLN